MWVIRNTLPFALMLPVIEVFMETDLIWLVLQYNSYLLQYILYQIRCLISAGYRRSILNYSLNKLLDWCSVNRNIDQFD